VINERLRIRIESQIWRFVKVDVSIDMDTFRK